ncbi:MAG: ADP-ribosylglycohydrolase family protein [Armatimonas sp.]
MNLPSDYEERVYAGVLGKIIGVYLGRPFEGWTNEHIERELGEVWYYVHEKLKTPLIVTDDDISGTFTFIRAIADNGYAYDVTEEQVGNTWLNYLIEDRTVLWWGGMGNSTEHTAFLRLKDGIVPPRTGSIALNGQTVAEQIGAQIFIDGWAMLAPGDPEKAAAFARKAASVSHDGEAIYGAQVIAAMESYAFVEPDLNKLLDVALTFIPAASKIHQMVTQIRGWHADEPRDWRSTFHKIQEKWGYNCYGGGCHMLPNHAVIQLALLYGDDDFQKSLMIANTAGWDTDCNSGNVGCLMGIKNGLAGIDKGADFRGPVADRLYVPTADGGRAISDAATKTYRIVNTARQMQDLKPLAPNEGMRYHFALPGSVQGFMVEDSVECRGTATIANVVLGELAENPGIAADERALAIRYQNVATGRAARVATATFTSPEGLKMPGYGMYASPILHPGQTLRARVVTDEANERPTHVGLFIRYYGENDTLEILRGDTHNLGRGSVANLSWELPELEGRPIAEVGIEIGGQSGTGAIYLDWLGWTGTPQMVLRRPDTAGTAWRRAWVNAADRYEGGNFSYGANFRIIQDRGTGLALYGEREWTDYSVKTTVQAHLADGVGIAAAVQGLRRYISLTLSPIDGVRMVLHRDGLATPLGEASILWKSDHAYELTLSVARDGTVSAEFHDGEAARFLTANIDPVQAQGAVGLVATVGHCLYGPVRIGPIGTI